MSIDEDRVRASDAEREKYAQMVREATGEGRLTLAEGDERLAQVYATRFRDELPVLVADLPAGRPSPAPVEVAQRWEGRRRYRHPYGPPLVPLLVLTGLFVALWAVSGAHFFWPIIPLMFFAFVLLRRALWWRRR